MSEVMSRDAYYGILGQMEEAHEQDEFTVGFTERHAFDGYVLVYEYDGNGVYHFDLIEPNGYTAFSVEGDIEYAMNAFRHKMGTHYFDKTRIGYQQGKEWYDYVSKPGVIRTSVRIQDTMIVHYEKKDSRHVFSSEGVVTGRKQCTLSDADFNKAAKEMMEDLDACGAFESDDEPIGEEGTELADIAGELQGGN